MFTPKLAQYDAAIGDFIDIEPKPQKIKTLFDIWENFGGEFSIDDNFNFNEGSQESLYDLIVHYEVDGEYPLKDRMIHIISNHSAWKSGATNVYPASA